MLFFLILLYDFKNMNRLQHFTTSVMLTFIVLSFLKRESNGWNLGMKIKNKNFE